MVVDHSMVEDELEVEEATKIFYCSRTHSQLSQFANEVRRVHFPSVVDDTASEHDPNAVVEEIKHLTLGSRKNLCINPRVSKLDSAVAINERCLELQKPKTSKEYKCEFLPNKENETLVHEFRDHTLAKIRDIEDLVGLGKRVGICPYYASRATIKPSEVCSPANSRNFSSYVQIVTLPYPLLLQKSAREALNLSLKNHIVIIDEAHNLMDAISNIHSSQVSLAQLTRGRAQLSLYIKKFRNRLKGKNLMYVTQTFRLVDSLGKYLQRERKPGELLNVSEIMAGNGLDQINLHKLCNYLQESNLARKVDGYVAFAEEVTEIKHEKRAVSTPVLMQIQTFFQALANPATEGRFFYESVDVEEVGIRYMLLDPSHHFREIVEEAKAVILAGGTMAPFDDYTRHLLPYLDPSRLKTLSCGHVIPVENMIAWPVSQSIEGVSLDFTHQNLSASDKFQKLVNSLGKLICDVLAHIPDGVVIFFPSYAILKKITQAWRVVSPPCKQGIWEQICAHKQIITESKESSNVDNILAEYSGLIDKGKGAVLLAVIGGKMSEGINFSDRLGRGVIVVGLPFPNIHSAEWRAREQYIRQSIKTRGGSAQEGIDMAREFTLNACMRAVNQSIGRAIRHQGDYACIIMLDKRYNSPNIQSKLPGWIQRSLVKNAGGKRFSEVSDSIRQFFEAKKLAKGR
jgi:chromosome transmission fidelity protein 1